MLVPWRVYSPIFKARRFDRGDLSVVVVRSGHLRLRAASTCPLHVFFAVRNPFLFHESRGKTAPVKPFIRSFKGVISHL